LQDYRRIVSYIHTYENNEKKKNVGFGKLEARGGIGKLSVQINGQNMLEGSVLSVYLLHITEYVNGVRLGECRVVQGRVNAEFRFGTENIMQSGYDISKMQGIYITTDAAPYAVFASSWTDAEIVPEKFRVGESDTEKAQEQAIEQESDVENQKNIFDTVEPETEMQIEEATVKAAVIANAEIPEINEDSLLASFMESLSEMEAFNEQTEFEEIVEESESAFEEFASDDDKEATVVNNAISQEMLYEMELESAEKTPWEELCCRFPKVIAFEGAEQPHRMCLKIDLKDLESIAGAKREFYENTYLVRCYYKYKYLLLIENEEDSEGKSCILGIPGTYCRNEGNLAKMFGFENFLPARIFENMNGRFGYWCKEIVL